MLARPGGAIIDVGEAVAAVAPAREAVARVGADPIHTYAVVARRAGTFVYVGGAVGAAEASNAVARVGVDAIHARGALLLTGGAAALVDLGGAVGAAPAWVAAARVGVGAVRTSTVGVAAGYASALVNIDGAGATGITGGAGAGVRIDGMSTCRIVQAGVRCTLVDVSAVARLPITSVPSVASAVGHPASGLAHRVRIAGVGTNTSVDRVGACCALVTRAGAIARVRVDPI
eukprot:SAG25_NODE_2532_length_1548_cov_4.236715_1_plen_230_part_10